jgi:hypothetical protein
MRKSGVTLERIRQAREYLSEAFDSQYPFAHFRFKTDGKCLFMDADQTEKFSIASEMQRFLGRNTWENVI